MSGVRKTGNSVGKRSSKSRLERQFQDEKVKRMRKVEEEARAIMNGIHAVREKFVEKHWRRIVPMARGLAAPMVGLDAYFKPGGLDREGIVRELGSMKDDAQANTCVKWSNLMRMVAMREEFDAMAAYIAERGKTFADMTSTVGGFDDPDFQALVDSEYTKRLYKDYVTVLLAKLREAGFTDEELKGLK